MDTVVTISQILKNKTAFDILLFCTEHKPYAEIVNTFKIRSTPYFLHKMLVTNLLTLENDKSGRKCYILTWLGRQILNNMENYIKVCSQLRSGEI